MWHSGRCNMEMEESLWIPLNTTCLRLMESLFSNWKQLTLSEHINYLPWHRDILSNTFKSTRTILSNFLESLVEVGVRVYLVWILWTKHPAPFSILLQYVCTNCLLFSCPWDFYTSVWQSIKCFWACHSRRLQNIIGFSGYKVGLRCSERVPKELLAKAGGSQICRNSEQFLLLTKVKVLGVGRKVIS